MPRPKICRFIQHPPFCASFKPKAVPARFLLKEILTLEELEAVKLADYQGLEHEAASVKIGISRTVFTRMLNAARSKIATAIIEGKELVFEGGLFCFEKHAYRCLSCYKNFITEKSEAVTACKNCQSLNVQQINEDYQDNSTCCQPKQ